MHRLESRYTATPLYIWRLVYLSGWYIRFTLPGMRVPSASKLFLSTYSFFGSYLVLCIVVFGVIIPSDLGIQYLLDSPGVL
ncbi:uncharacterized protein BJX67DRAFT_339915 [Aspergillus lucknowensis]|uniref:Uncharacterized protein n=1 Tax=Aspergillus lucknowensis TaxID=176173 RepID=A0ABR4M7P0_9EURO